MVFRTLGSTDLRTSVIGLGTWQLGGEWARVFTQADVDAILDEAAACGINLIDTAECYGDHLSESLIGNYLARHNRSRWILATKFGHHFNKFMDRTGNFSPAGAREQLEASLRSLRTDTIDLYQFHSGNDNAFDNDDLWKVLHEEQQKGKIRHLGVSILGKGSEHQAQEARSRGAEILQVIYNRLDRRPEQLYFPHAERDNLGILARVPLASGLLSGKYRPGATFHTGDVRATFDSQKLACDLAAADRIGRTEVPDSTPMAQWALAWCLQNPRVSAVIPGCKDPAQVRSNAAAANLIKE